MLDRIDYANGTITIGDKTHELLDKNFPTITPSDPFKLTKKEEIVMEKLRSSMRSSQRLQQHINFLYTHGSMYLTYNSNLLYHGCIPMTKKGDFETFEIEGTAYSGKAPSDNFDRIARIGY